MTGAAGTRWVFFVRNADDGGSYISGPIDVPAGQVTDLVFVGFEEGQDFACEFSAEVSLAELGELISSGRGISDHPAATRVFQKDFAEDPPGGLPN